jgi:predicted DNA-binding transcriptional regulator AlpA
MMAFFQLKPEDKTLTTKHMKDQFGYSQTTLWRMRQNGTGPEYINKGGKVLYVERVVLDWLSESTYKSTAEEPAALKGKRYQHLPAARLLGVAANKAKHAAKKAAKASN